MDISLVNPKSQKCLEESNVRDNEDRISKLPDSVLCHILSFLSTKNVISTSILATRWKNLWASVPNLDFDHEDFSDDYELMNFVDNVLIRREMSCIRNFIIRCGKRVDLSRLTTCIRAIVKCKVEHLEIYKHASGSFELPWSLYTCKTLVDLKLCNVVLGVPPSVCLPSVKILHLYGVEYMEDEAFKALVSSCPVLEDLSIARFDGDNLKVLCVCSQALKNLTIFFYEACSAVEYEVMIDATNLECLRLTDHVSKSIIINNLSSLVKAVIDVSLRTFTLTNDIPKKLLHGISNARHLNLYYATVQVLCGYNLYFKKILPMPEFCNLIYLELEFDYFGWKLLPALLENSPKLEAVFFKGFVPESYELMLTSVPQCLLSCLESIEIQICNAWEKGMDPVRYFLKNSKVLKKLTVHLHCNPQKEKSIILKEIIMFERGSSECQILVM